MSRWRTSTSVTGTAAKATIAATRKISRRPLMKTPRALEIVGPAAFGYPDLTFKPL